MSNYLNYLKDGDYNLWVSLLNDKELVHLFDILDEQMLDICKHFSKNSDLTVKDSYYYQATFFLVTNRQLRNAYACLLRRQSYDAMLLLRPALESTVFAYRIFKDPELIMVWVKKHENRKEFAKHFKNDVEYPVDMPHKDDFKKQIDRINEYYSHANLNYFASTVEHEKSVIHVNSFDRDDGGYYLNLLSFLSYVLRILEVMRKTIESRFPVYFNSTQPEFGKLKQTFNKLKERYGKQYNLKRKNK